MVRESGEAVLIDFGLSRHDQLPDLLQEEFHLPLGTGPLHLARAGHGGPHRPAQRSFCARRHALLFRHGAAAVRHARRTQGAAAALLARPRAPAPAQPGRPALAAGADPALPGGRSGPAARNSRPTRLRPRSPGPGATDSAGRTHGAGRFPDRRAAALPGRSRRAAAAGAAARLRPSGRRAVMAAVDLAPEMEALADALRLIVRRILAVETKARLACVNVLKTPRIGVDFGEDEQGRN